MEQNKLIIIATHNKGKAAEFEALFEPLGYEVKTMHDFPDTEPVEETGLTFEENARLKAETVAAEMGTFVLADDSGLAVDGLDGLPGVHSARFAGEEASDAANNAKLLAELGEDSRLDRTAHFHCTLALAHPARETLIIKGQVDGEIAKLPQGEHGFGYDPLFYLPDRDQTMAQLTAAEKNKISHRADAIKQLKQQLNEWLADEGDVF